MVLSERGQKALILIVDDQRFNRQMIAGALNPEEYDILEAEDGRQAVDIFLKENADIVLMDAVMPNMTGFEACRLIRAAEKDQKTKTPILMITALGDTDSINDGFAAGVNDFIQKPINLDILRRRLEIMIKEIKSSEEVRRSEERFRLLAENAQDFIVIIQLEPLSYEYISPVVETITGYRTNEFYSDPLLFHKIINHKDSFRLNTILSGKISEPQVFEMRLMHKLGHRVVVECHAVPVKVNKRVIGIQIIARDITERKKDEIRRQIELTKRVLFETVRALSTTIETRDPYTSGHQYRVAKLAVAIAKEMELDLQSIESIETAALLHDLGKITVPAEYLSKPGKLSVTEFDIIKNHPLVGYEILQPVEFEGPIAKIVYQHHERNDGSGYPLGLKADEILIEAKVIAVADTVEAMSSHRPYRPALGFEVAMEEIKNHHGKYYDPIVSQACLDVNRKGNILF